MTLHSSKLAKWVAYDFCAPRVGRCVKRKLRPESIDPSLLSPTSATPCPSSEGGSMTIAKGRVSIFTFPRFSRSPVLPNRIYANFVAKTRLHTLCPLIGEIEKTRRREPAGCYLLGGQIGALADERHHGRPCRLYCRGGLQEGDDQLPRKVQDTQAVRRVVRQHACDLERVTPMLVIWCRRFHHTIPTCCQSLNGTCSSSPS